MNASDAEILWQAACGLARTAESVSRGGRRRGDAPPPLLFFTDLLRTPRPWETAARLPAGAAVVYRHFGAADAGDAARRLREATGRAGVRLLVGLDAPLAAQVGADGVHLPERALEQAAALAAAHPDWWITGAAHGAGGLARAGALDAVVLSPVFPAGGASGDRPALGLERFRTLVAGAPAPVYALGGIDATNAHELAGSGACGLAGVGAIRAAFGPD